MKIPSITILSSTQNTVDRIRRQLEEYFGNCVRFRCLVLGADIQPRSVHDDLVVVTSFSIAGRALPLIRPGTPYFVSGRVIQEETIGRLYQIPPGTKVLLYNITEETALECLSQLKERGIRHLDLYPFHPGSESYPKDCAYVLTFGEADTAPKMDCPLLDFDVRPMDIPSCVKIALEVGIYDQVRENLSVAAVRPGLEMSFHLSQQLKIIQELSDDLQMILDQSEDSILLLDDTRKIQFYNSAAKRLLKIHNNTSPFLYDVFPGLDPYNVSYFVQIQGRTYNVEVRTNLQGSNSRILLTIRDMESIHEIEQNYSLARQKGGFVARYTFHDIIHQSEQMESVITRCRQFAASNSTVAIYGDSGCGKELLAQAIHNASPRKQEAFVGVNFAALPSTLCEAELFGYEEGAFTGAKRGGKRGLFALANNGTIFLDEIGDCSLDVQKKILRVIQERTVMPLGSNRLIPLNIRIITATKQDLYQMVQKNEFREDLYYRLNVLPIYVPPLSERKEDIIPLFLYFLNKHFGIHLSQLSPELAEHLLRHDWKGNVRELKNVAEYIANCIISNVHWQEQKEYIFQSSHSSEPELPNPGEGCEAPPAPMEDLLRLLEQQHELSSVRIVLNALSASPFRWTRQKLLESINHSSSMSESNLKRILADLKKNGLTQSKTGYGTYLTEAGKEFAHYFESAL